MSHLRTQLMELKMTINQLELIFLQWSSSLKFKDRKRHMVAANFDELFESLKNANASFEEAHAILPRAIKAHQPTKPVAHNSYKSLKNRKLIDCSEAEFVDQWNKSIADTATHSFFEWFPLPKDEDDDEPKLFGSMSAKEYRKQRNHAESFPILNTKELVAQWKNRSEDTELEILMKQVLGELDDSNT